MTGRVFRMKSCGCVFFVYIVVCIGGDYVECIDGDDFCGVCQVHCLCKGHGDSQACEAAGPYGDVDLLDLAGLSAKAVQNITDGWKNLRTVPDGCRKSSFGEDFFAERYCNGAYSAGCFNRYNKRFLHHILYF